MLVLAFDTATDVATSALLEDGSVLGERVGIARSAALLTSTRCSEAPGGRRGTSTRSSSARAREASRAPGSGWLAARGPRARPRHPGRGVSTLAALARRRPARSRSSTHGVGRCSSKARAQLSPDDLEIEPGTLCVGNGAVRYRATLERMGAVVPPDDDDGTSRTRACTRRSRASSGRSTRSSRSTSALPDAEAATRVNVELRRLDAHDLDARRGDRARVVPDAMVALDVRRGVREAELARDRRVHEGRRLVGYAFVSRYVDAWHVMNVAVANAFRRRGIASALLERLFEVTATDPRRGYTLEVRVSNGGRHPACTSGSASRRAGSGAATTRTIARTRSSCGASRPRPSAPS